MAPPPEDTHLPQGDEKVKIADFVHSSLPEKSSSSFLPSSTDFKGKLSKVEMGPESEALS